MKSSGHFEGGRRRGVFAVLFRNAPSQQIGQAAVTPRQSQRGCLSNCDSQE